MLDDESDDDTAVVVHAAAGGDPRVRLVAGRPVPPGWLGKPHACGQLAAAATGTVLVFADADVLVAPDGIARTVGLLRDSGLDFVSPYPRQEAVTTAERLVQPLLQWSWLTFLPLRAAERSGRPSLSAVNGQLLCVDAAAYRRAGGHDAVRDAVLDDLALARAMKRAGGRGTVADGTAVATTRMYRTWPDLRDGYSEIAVGSRCHTQPIADRGGWTRGALRPAAGRGGRRVTGGPLGLPGRRGGPGRVRAQDRRARLARRARAPRLGRGARWADGSVGGSGPAGTAHVAGPARRDPAGDRSHARATIRRYCSASRTP